MMRPLSTCGRGLQYQHTRRRPGKRPVFKGVRAVTPTPGSPKVVVFDDPQQLAAAAADTFHRIAYDAIIHRGRFRVALAGGSTPETTYTQLTRPGERERTAWSRVDFLFGDERMVPPDD